MSDQSTQAVIEQLAGMFDHLDEMAPPVRLHELDGWEETRLDVARRDELARTYRRRRQLVGVAAALVVAMGVAGLWWLIGPGGDSDTVVPTDEPDGSTDASPPATAMTPPNITDPAVGPTPADGNGDDGDAAGPNDAAPIAERLAAMDAWEAAQLFQPDALYVPSPAQAADLTIANELTSRACYEQQGIALPPFDPDRLALWQTVEDDKWDLRRRWWTPSGQRELRERGNTHYRSLSMTTALEAYPHMEAPVPEECYPAATGVTYLGGPRGWSDTQLQSALTEGDERWMPMTSGFGRLPGTEDARRGADDCMLARGWDEWLEPNAYWDLRHDAEASATEIELTNDLIDCYDQVGAPAIFLTAATEYVDDFRVEFADELAAVAAERADDLAEAYDVLRAAGLDPLSD